MKDDPGLHIFIAHLRSDGGLVHFYKHPMLVRMCGDSRGNIQGEPENLKRVRVTEDSEGPYWVWYSNEKSEFTIIYRNPVLRDVCFPDGPEAEERRGRGRRTRARVEILGDAE